MVEDLFNDPFKVFRSIYMDASIYTPLGVFIGTLNYFIG